MAQTALTTQPGMSVRMRLVGQVVAVLSCLLIAASSCSSGVAAPEAQPGDVVLITLEEAAAIRDDDEPFVFLDVRDNLTFRQSHVVGAQNVDVNNPTAWADRTAVLDPNRRTVVYCGDQQSCDDAVTKLLDLEFMALFLIGPYDPESNREEWRAAGLPIDR